MRNRFSGQDSRPARWAALLRKGLDLQGKHKFREAERAYQLVLLEHPGHPQAQHLIGTLALEAGNVSVAAEYFRGALAAIPDNPLFLNNLGNALIEQRQFDEAIMLLHKAIAINPDFIEALCSLSRAYRLAGRARKGKRFIEQAFAKAPDHAMVRINFGQLLVDLGLMEQAARLFRDAIASGHALPRAYAGLAVACKFTAADREIDAIEAMLKDDNLKEGTRLILHHAAGKIYDDLDDHDAAFAHFGRAKDIAGRSFNIVKFRSTLDELRGIFIRPFFEMRREYGDPTDLPVFIIGMPRSGTTLTEQICASHPAVHGAGELGLIGRMASELGFGGTPGQFAHSLAALTREQSRTLAQRYLTSVRRDAPRAQRITDKMPHNFQHLGLIALLFPNARIVHCRREPVDTCISCFTHNFNDAHGYNANLESLGFYYREYVRLMEHWRLVLPLSMFENRYEALIADQEAESRQITAFMGLPWNDACLAFFATQRSVTTPSRWQVRQPIYATSVARWRKYERHLAPLFGALGDLAPKH